MLNQIAKVFKEIDNFRHVDKFFHITALKTCFAIIIWCSILIKC